MSFSFEVKQELSKFDNYDKRNLLAELIGFIYCENCTENDDYYEYITENEFCVEHLYKILFNLEIDYEPEIRGKCYVAQINKCNVLENVLNNYGEMDEKYSKYLVKGAFLGAGYVNNPDKNYHLELLFCNEEFGRFIKNVCEKNEIWLKELYNDEKYQLYIKDAEEISKFLALIGANNSVLRYEDIRVLKDMKNNINRKVNCETANLNKTIESALSQIDDIKLIKSKGNFSNLSNDLQEIANLRLENPEASLKEIAEMTSSKISRSGVNSRFKKIHEIAENL